MLFLAGQSDQAMKRIASKTTWPVQAVVAETVKLAVLLGGLLGGGLLLGGPLALRAFTSDPAAIAAAAPLLPLVAASQPINALAFVWDGGW
jgi:Na+-driven multidrug efflux pump